MLPRTLLLPRLTQTARRSLHCSSVVLGGGGDIYWGPEQAAGRETVGYGTMGGGMYVDRVDYWFPSIRFKKVDDEIRPILAKEQGDWTLLSIEDKKKLYRHSFCATLSEYHTGHGYWKPIFVWSLTMITFSLLYNILFADLVYKGSLPTTKNPYKEAMMERSIDLHSGPITGLASQWDYENKKWIG